MAVVSDHPSCGIIGAWQSSGLPWGKAARQALDAMNDDLQPFDRSAFANRLKRMEAGNGRDVRS